MSRNTIPVVNIAPSLKQMDDIDSQIRAWSSAIESLDVECTRLVGCDDHDQALAALGDGSANRDASRENAEDCGVAISPSLAQALERKSRATASLRVMGREVDSRVNQLRARANSISRGTVRHLSAVSLPKEIWEMILSFLQPEIKMGWICALYIEYVAAKAFLDETHAPPESVSTNDNNIYTLGKIGKHNTVIAILPHGEYGIAPAASVARDMLHSFPNIRIGLMVGIGGGAPSPKHDIRLGDIVVSASGNGKYGGVFNFDHGKVIQNQRFQESGFLNQPPTILRTAIVALRAEHKVDGHQLERSINDILDKKPRLRKNYRRPLGITDRLYQPTVLHQPDDAPNCDLCGNDPSSLKFRAERTNDEDNPAIHYGLIASSNKLMKNAIIRNELAEKGVLCFETEAAGLVNHFPCLVIRGICDYADTHKNDNWQGYAAMAAAAYAKDLLSQIHPNKAEAEKKISEVLSDLQNEVTATSKKADTIIRHHLTQQHKELLEWLTLADYSLFQCDNIGRRQPGTGQWLLNSPEFCNWRDSPNQTLFCPGIPGAGKTILTSIVIDSLKTQFVDYSNIGIAYVYCNFRRREEQTARELLASVLKQLLQGLKTIPESVESLHRAGSRLSLESISSALLWVAERFSRVFVLIDALDECRTSDGTRTRFLSEIFDLQSKCQINIFATSRPIPDVTRLFTNCASLEVRATDDDVRMFVRGRMPQLPEFFGQQGLEEDITSQIVRSVQGMFLLAQLHLDSLRDKTSVAAVRKALNQLPSGSDAYYHAYEIAMERVRGQLQGHKDLAMQVLSWITCAKRPLTVEELRHALAVEVGTDEVDMAALHDTSLMVHVCIGLVTIDESDGIIRLAHYTTQEYFEKTQTTWFPKAENYITTTCVTYLSFRAFKSGCCEIDADFKKRAPLYLYAANNWAFHARNAATICEGVIDFLESGPNVESSAQVCMRPELAIMSFEEGRNIHRRARGLHLASFFGATAEARTLLLTNYVELKEGYGRTAIFYAARTGQEAVMNLLLDSGAKADLQDKGGNTPLSLAAAYGQEGCVKLLLANGVKTDTEDDFRRTPLCYASEKGHDRVIRLLLEAGSNVNWDGDGPYTPLWYAVARDHITTVRLLLENGARANPALMYGGGQSPLSRACRWGNQAMVQLLLKYGAQVDSNDDQGETPLEYAACYRHIPILLLLLHHSKSIDLKGLRRQTRQSRVARHGDPEIIKIILENSKKFLFKSSLNHDPLACAVDRALEEVSDCLARRRKPNRGPPSKAPSLAFSNTVPKGTFKWKSLLTDTFTTQKEFSSLKRMHQDDGTVPAAVLTKTQRI
ncbi:purine and uridine phosphorylase [Fusarium tjaetaba]|uniref:Purine and uridine phosphorylase n=1 Tax=Fusarium tjaetaba TaxID=1567544 RepID=A0A8H5RF27_9HYPO|nr:purine and uridine phosphorylase [Fusarium tjaetaba]KAF5630756.1 purine and uridine phosphorylase [Fusarium tjaetaba]